MPKNIHEAKTKPKQIYKLQHTYKNNTKHTTHIEKTYRKQKPYKTQ